MHVDFDVEHIDIGKLLEQHPLALHHWLGSQRTPVAQAKDGCTVGNDRHKVALAGIFIGHFRVFFNF